MSAGAVIEQYKRWGNSVELRVFDHLTYERRLEIARALAAATTSSAEQPLQMLPITPEEVYAKYKGVVALVDGQFGGYVGAMQPLEHGVRTMSEVGSLWVPGEFRRHGIGTALTKSVSRLIQLDGITPYAFCNPSSKGIFDASGYRERTLRDVPEEAGSLCARCPKLGARVLGVECCDTVMVYEEQHDK